MVFSKFYLNTIGTFFDKILPFFISIYLSSLLTVDDFGKWSLFYQFVLVLYAASISPSLGLFSKNFNLDNDKIILYSSRISIPILLFIFLTFQYLYGTLFYLELIGSLSHSIYFYIALYLRFSNNDKVYAMLSFVKFFTFIIIIGYSFMERDNLAYDNILFAFTFSNFISIIVYFKKFEMDFSKSFCKEWILLGVYGFFSSLVAGADKFIIAKISISDSLGVYSYIIFLCSIPNLIVEPLKKSFQPIIFNDIKLYSKISKKTIKNLTLPFSLVSIIQMILPVFVIYILNFFGMVNPEIFDTENIYDKILITSFGMFFWNSYHFINPYFISKSKTFTLIKLNALSLFGYALLMLSLPKSMINAYFLKSLLLIIIPVFTYLLYKNETKKTN